MYIFTGSVENSNQTVEMSKDVRKKILEAASEAFSAYGYDKTTVEDIAKMAGKAKTTVYYYFEGKAEIFSAALEEEVRAMQDGLAVYLNPTSGNIVPSLRDYLKKRMDALLGSRLYRKFLVEAIMRGNRSEYGSILLKAREPLDLAERQFFSLVCAFAKETGALDNKVEPEIFGEMLTMVLRGVEVQILLSDDEAASMATYDEMVNFITNTDNYSGR